MHCMSTLVDIPLFTSNWSACQYRPSILFSKTMTRTFLNSRNSNSVMQNGMLLKYFGISWRQVIVCCCWDCSLIILFERFHMHSNSDSQLKDTHPLLCAPFIWRSQIQVGGVSGRPPRDSTHHPARSWQARWLSYSCWTGTGVCAGNGYIIDYCYIAQPYLPIRTAVNPLQKLDWFHNHMLEKYGDAKAIFVQAVCIC